MMSENLYGIEGAVADAAGIIFHPSGLDGTKAQRQ